MIEKFGKSQMSETVCLYIHYRTTDIPIRQTENRN